METQSALWRHRLSCGDTVHLVETRPPCGDTVHLVGIQSTLWGYSPPCGDTSTLWRYSPPCGDTVHLVGTQSTLWRHVHLVEIQSLVGTQSYAPNSSPHPAPASRSCEAESLIAVFLSEQHSLLIWGIYLHPSVLNSSLIEASLGL